MRRRIHRLAYRLAAPLANGWWTLWGSDHEGAKCLITNGGEVLLVRHTYGDRRRWGLPGGHVRRGEAPRAAASREMREELDLAVRPGDLRELGALSLRLRRRCDTVHYFHLELPDRVVDPDSVELSEARWFAPAALPGRLGAHVAQVTAWLGPTNTGPGSGPG